MDEEEERILKQMDLVLNELVLNAEEMAKVSKHDISEEELLPLQSKQEKLIQEIVKLDADYHIHLFTDHTSQFPQLRQKIREKLQSFESLNLFFIKNLQDLHGLIKFDGKKKSKH